MTAVTDFDSFKTAMTAGGIVSVDADITVSENDVEFEIAQTTLLDFKGHKIVVEDSNNDGRTKALMLNRGSLTIMDSSPEGTGLIRTRSIDNYGTICLQGGTIENPDNSINGGYAGAAIWNNDHSKFNMTGGALKATGTPGGIADRAKGGVALNVDGAEARIYGGTITSTGNAIVANEGAGLYLGAVTVAGGTSGVGDFNAVKSQRGEITIDGTTVTGESGANAVYAEGGSILVEGDARITAKGAPDPAKQSDWMGAALAVALGGALGVHEATVASDHKGAAVYSTGGTITFRSETPQTFVTSPTTGAPATGTPGVNEMTFDGGTLKVSAGDLFWAAAGASGGGVLSGDVERFVAEKSCDAVTSIKQPARKVGTQIDASDIESILDLPDGASAELFGDQGADPATGKLTLASTEGGNSATYLVTCDPDACGCMRLVTVEFPVWMTTAPETQELPAAPLPETKIPDNAPTPAQPVPAAPAKAPAKASPLAKTGSPVDALLVSGAVLLVAGGALSLARRRA